MDPLHHYALIGAAPRWDPGPRFSTDFYLQHNHDLARGNNALLHYVRQSRPALRTAEVFTTMVAPVRPLTRAAVTHVVRAALRQV